MHSTTIWYLGPRARRYLSCRPWLAGRQLRSRRLVGCALAFLLSIAAGQPPRSQNSMPEAPPPAANEFRRSASPTEPAAQTAAASPSSPVDEVKAYLWSVYQRSPTKVDGHGDFTWKDVSAAGRSGLSVEDYAIGGLDPDFRELLFAAGHAMDAAGVGWTILSGFRDDFRQKLASGLKARVNNSFHGGSEATGGYRHGCAVDLASVDRLSDDKVWNWVEREGREFYLFRPLRTADPAHTLPMAGWHELAATLRNQRLGISAEADPAPLGDLVTLEQYLCVRPLPSDSPPAGAQVAETVRHGAASWKPGQGPRHEANSHGNGAPQKPAGVREQRAQPIRAAFKPARSDKPQNDAAARMIGPAHAISGQPSTRALDRDR
jgi:hypothetical protein